MRLKHAIGNREADMPDPATSLELAQEREHLTRADRDIAAGEERIARQRELIGHLQSKGLSVAEAEALLETLSQTLLSWRDHRALILDRIAHLESKPDG